MYFVTIYKSLKAILNRKNKTIYIVFFLKWLSKIVLILLSNDKVNHRRSSKSYKKLHTIEPRFLNLEVIFVLKEDY